MTQPGPESTTAERDAEVARIRSQYARRNRAGSYESDWKVRLFLRQQRERVLLGELARAGSLPLADRRVLDVGCGSGQWLADFETWGARRGNLAGIELDGERAAEARQRLAAGGAQGGADIREGNASALPWADGTFDVVLQSTVISSILDAGLRRDVAAEMARVLAPGGTIVSYDMRLTNPRNPHVRKLGRRELAELFDGFQIRTRRVTLILQVTRRVVGPSWTAAAALESTRLPCSHLLAIARRPDATMSCQ
jgi:ubiquinone/menaquinone biosynthesis C-methylase UbiE